MGKWRLIQLETHNAFMNMAMDEAILTSRIEDATPNTIRFYRWNPSAVSIGKFQKIHNEIQLDNCKTLGVDVVRRMTGGGTVYHDAEDEITYCIVADRKDLNADDITAVYSKVYSGLVEALRVLGVTADFNEGNKKTCPNLTVKGKKISGSAQAHKGGVVLQHGTLLLNVDLERMFTLLRVPWAETCMQVANIAKDKITSLKEELGKKPSVVDVENALIRGFRTAFKVNLDGGKLTEQEQYLAEKLYKEKYMSEEWNFHGNSPAA
ncbi:lipoate--protein ligase family protein [Candidatus Bathyarchaeota archaeon]|nr:lipoate--protein ligase family protein [Candidatus Bathyarchaeota archaeon]